jgi:hypothetical protein
MITFSIQETSMVRKGMKTIAAVAAPALLSILRDA